MWKIFFEYSDNSSLTLTELRVKMDDGEIIEYKRLTIP